jgi:hypothetical protein
MTERTTLLVLDDDPTRHSIFAAAADPYEVLQTYQVESFREALAGCTSLGIVALDHDLGGGVNANRPLNECGCDAAELVARSVSPAVPVLIHSANGPCSQAMRLILMQAGYRGRVSRINFNTIMKGDERAGVEMIREEVLGLAKRPHWPDDLSLEELVDMLGDNPATVCPVRTPRQ